MPLGISFFQTILGKSYLYPNLINYLIILQLFKVISIPIYFKRLHKINIKIVSLHFLIEIFFGEQILKMTENKKGILNGLECPYIQLLL